MSRAWIVTVAALVLTATLVHATPLPDEEEGSGSHTLTALKNFFSPITNYFKGIPSKTPAEIGEDVKNTMVNVRDWADENDAVQTLKDALTPVKTWIQEKADVMKDQTFNDMYESVKTSVKDMDERVGTWLQEKTSK